MSLFNLALLFVKFGFLCFGGGYMLIPLLSADLVDRYKLLTLGEFSNLVSIAQVTPGPVGINTATYVGFEQAGILGGVIATFALLLPGLFLTLLAMKLLRKYEKSLLIQGFLTGMRPAAFGLILAAAVIFAQLSIFTAPIPWQEFARNLLGGRTDFGDFDVRYGAVVITAVSFWLLKKDKISFLWILLLSALAGSVLCAG